MKFSLIIASRTLECVTDVGTWLSYTNQRATTNSIKLLALLEETGTNEGYLLRRRPVSADLHAVCSMLADRWRSWGHYVSLTLLRDVLARRHDCIARRHDCS